jgi:alanyl-tRNA synthetase
VLKRLYGILAVVAIANLVVLAGVAAYAWATGRIDRERIGRIAEVLSGQAAGEPSPATQPATTQPVVQASQERIRQNEELEEILMRRLERQRREVEDLASLTDAARLKVLQDRETLQQETARWEQRKEAWEKQQHLDGFKRTLAYLEGVDAKVAKSLLQERKDADAARILASMNERKARAVIEECTAPHEREWIGRILQMIEMGSVPEGVASTTAPAGSSG